MDDIKLVVYLPIFLRVAPLAQHQHVIISHDQTLSYSYKTRIHIHIYTVECRYNAVQYCKILHTDYRNWGRISMRCWIHKISHTSVSYEAFSEYLCKNWLRYNGTELYEEWSRHEDTVSTGDIFENSYSLIQNRIFLFYSYSTSLVYKNMNAVFQEGNSYILPPNNIQPYTGFSELFTYNDDGIYLKSQIPIRRHKLQWGLGF